VQRLHVDGGLRHSVAAAGTENIGSSTLELGFPLIALCGFLRPALTPDGLEVWLDQTNNFVGDNLGESNITRMDTIALLQAFRPLNGRRTIWSRHSFATLTYY
jgi:hypothetical protein